MSKLIDTDGYPTDEALRLVKTTPSPKVFEVLREAWWMAEGGVSNDLRPEEAAVVGDHGSYPPGTFWRFATGGWSGNEELMAVFRQTWAYHMTWRLSAAGGLFIFDVPPFTIQGGFVRARLPRQGEQKWQSRLARLNGRASLPTPPSMRTKAISTNSPHVFFARGVFGLVHIFEFKNVSSIPDAFVGMTPRPELWKAGRVVKFNPAQIIREQNRGVFGDA